MKIEYMREMKRSYMTVKMEDWEIAESYVVNAVQEPDSRSFKNEDQIYRIRTEFPGIVMISLPVSLSAGYLKASQQDENR